MEEIREGDWKASAGEARFVDKLGEDQIDGLVALFRRETWSRSRTGESVRQLLANSRIVALIATDGEILAFARYLSDGVCRAMIYDVIVAEKCRGQGNGKRLLEHLLKQPLLRNVERVELYCREQNISFYEKWGFSKVAAETNLLRRSGSPG
ncbi:MAG: GNAT family N-acetyltransferase [Negativicutes bacterium]|nr:GNAT family N-acetyltransferase [Negativicutes bacterium]